MLYLIWGLLNIGIFLYFILICFNLAKLAKERLGIFASIVFVLGLVSFISKSAQDSSNNYSALTEKSAWKINSEDSVPSKVFSTLDVELGKTLVSRHTVSIRYGRNRQGLLVPVTAGSSESGFVSGRSWAPHSIVVNRTNTDNVVQYFVVGLEEWMLLGVRVYSQPVEYRGQVLLL